MKSRITSFLSSPGGLTLVILAAIIFVAADIGMLLERRPFLPALTFTLAAVATQLGRAVRVKETSCWETSFASLGLPPTAIPAAGPTGGLLRLAALKRAKVGYNETTARQ